MNKFLGMMMVLGSVALAACGSGGGGSKGEEKTTALPEKVAFNLGECPAIEGTFRERDAATQGHDERMTVRRTPAGFLAFTFNNDQPLLVDGLRHGRPDGTFVATCDHQKVIFNVENPKGEAAQIIVEKTNGVVSALLSYPGGSSQKIYDSIP